MLHRRGALKLIALGSIIVALLGAGGSNAGAVSPRASSDAPGVSAHQVSVGAVATLSGGLAADFAPIVPGVRAYLDMVNAQGGVYGRKVVLTKALDDGTVNNAAVTRTLVEQDHVFAVVGMATPFFSGQPFLVQTNTPTFGYAVQNDWAYHKNLFSAYGSLVDYTTTEPYFPYIAKRLGARVASVISYNVPQSSDECNAAVKGLKSHGVTVGYSDLAVPYGSSLSSDVVHMKQAKVDFIVSCMDLPGNLTLSRELQQNGVSGVKQVWLDGYDLSTLKKYPSLMQNTYFLLQHVPFQAGSQFPGVFPGLRRYLTMMNRYEPAYTANEVAMEGWLDAALFVAGLRAAGPVPTQAKLLDAVNHITDFTGNGLITPVNWEISHSVVTSPTCETFVEAVGTTFKVVFNQGHDIWVCFPLGSSDLKTVPPQPGAPGT